jgi:hypothetical protein
MDSSSDVGEKLAHTSKNNKYGHHWKNGKMQKIHHCNDDDDENDSLHTCDTSNAETQSERSGGSKGEKSKAPISQYSLGRGLIESDPLAISKHVEDIKWTYRRYAPYMHVMALYRRSGRTCLLGYNDLYISRQIIKCIPHLPFTMVSNMMDTARNDLLNLECALLSHTTAFSVWRHINQATELLQQPIADISHYDDSLITNEQNLYSGGIENNFVMSKVSIAQHKGDSHNIPISSSQFYARALSGQSVNSLAFSSVGNRILPLANQGRNELLLSKHFHQSSHLSSVSSFLSTPGSEYQVSNNIASDLYTNLDNSNASIVTNIVFELFPPVSLQAVEVLRMFIENKKYLSLNGQARILEVPEGMTSCVTVNTSYLNWLPSRLCRHVARLSLSDDNPFDCYRICCDYYNTLKKNFSFNNSSGEESKEGKLSTVETSITSSIVSQSPSHVSDKDPCPTISYNNDLILRLLNRVPVLTFSIYYLLTFQEESSMESRKVKARLRYLFPAFVKFPINNRLAFKALKEFGNILQQQQKNIETTVQFFAVEWVKILRAIFGDRLSRLESISFEVILCFFASHLLHEDPIDFTKLRVIINNLPLSNVDKVDCFTVFCYFVKLLYVCV